MTDNLVLHSYRRCPFAIRVRMTLEEKGIPYALKEENLNAMSDDLLNHHPEGRVPLLIHEVNYQKRVIYQSTIITEYLDETFAAPKYPLLMPLDIWSRTELRIWTYWCDTVFKPDLDLFKYHYSSMNSDNQQLLVQRLNQQLLKWDHALQSTGYLIGDKLTLADIHLFPFARQFFKVKLDPKEFGSFTALKIWLDDIQARPSFEKVMKKTLAEGD